MHGGLGGKLGQLDWVGDLERAGFGKEVILGRGAHGPIIIESEGNEGDAMGVECVYD